MDLFTLSFERMHSRTYVSARKYPDSDAPNPDQNSKALASPKIVSPQNILIIDPLPKSFVVRLGKTYK
jgi:hypothetical protein